MKPLVVAAALLLFGCGGKEASAPTADVEATAAAERKAVADTAAARHDAAVPITPMEQNGPTPG